MNDVLITYIDPDDLNELYKGIHQKLENKDHKLNDIVTKLQTKYQDFQISDNDKKLIIRFQFRLKELEQKIKSQEQLDYLITLQSYLKLQNFSNFLCQIFPIQQQQLQLDTNILQNVTIVQKSNSNWKENHSINKKLYNYYEDLFWKLYGIMFLNEEHYEGLILYYQTKQENVERLYKQSLERNKYFQYIKNQHFPDLATLNQLTISLNNETIQPEKNINYKYFEISKSNNKQTLCIDSINPISIYKKKYRNSYHSINQENKDIFSQDLRQFRVSSFSDQRSVGKYDTLNRQSLSPQKKKKIYVNFQKMNPINLNESFNSSIIHGISPTRSFRKPKQNISQNSTFYQQLLPSARITNKPFLIMKSTFKLNLWLEKA